MKCSLPFYSFRLHNLATWTYIAPYVYSLNYPTAVGSNEKFHPITERPDQCCHCYIPHSNQSTLITPHHLASGQSYIIQTRLAVKLWADKLPPQHQTFVYAYLPFCRSKEQCYTHMKILLSVKLPSLERWDVTLCSICAASNYLKNSAISLNTSFNDLDWNENLQTREVRSLEFRLLNILFPVSA